jgi:hypothetical protein
MFLVTRVAFPATMPSRSQGEVRAFQTIDSLAKICSIPLPVSLDIRHWAGLFAVYPDPYQQQ